MLHCLRIQPCHPRVNGNPEMGIKKHMDSCFRRNDKKLEKDNMRMARIVLLLHSAWYDSTEV
jgi:hypothetical protein